MAERGLARSRRVALAVALAALAHGAALGVLVLVPWSRAADADAARGAPADDRDADADAADPTTRYTGPAARVALVDGDVPHLPLSALDLPPPPARRGVGDALGATDTHPAPRAPVDEPGATAAAIGGGAAGGAPAWTGRVDRDQGALRAEPWNGGAAYRSAHDDTGAAPRTPEAIHRAPAADDGDRARAAVGAVGAAPSRGDRDAPAPGAGAAAPSPLDDDPRFAPPAGRTAAGAATTRATTAPAPAPGASRPSDHAAYADVGAPAADVARHGPAADDRAVAAASDQRRPDPYDLTPPSAGGDASGVRGPGGDGTAARGPRAGGTGASTADVAAGAAGLTVTADAEDPYFRAFLRKLEAAVVFPHQLAVEMRAGRVIASFAVDGDGRIRDLRVDVPSAYAAFDAALVAGLRQVGTLGPPPRRLVGAAGGLRVRVPFTFANPMIR